MGLQTLAAGEGEGYIRACSQSVIHGVCMPKSYTTAALAEALDGQLIGDGAITVSRLAHPADIQSEHDLALVMDAKLIPLLAKGKARAAVVSGDTKLERGLVEACIIVDRTRLPISRLTNLFTVPVPVAPGIHPTAVIEAGAVIGKNVAIGAQSFIGRGAEIGDNSTLHPQTYIGPGAVIGQDALIYAGVKIGGSVRVGQRSIIHFNAALGADGFSFVTPQNSTVDQAKSGGSGTANATGYKLERIASLGGVVIGDDVEIGANSCVDQGTIMPTRIGNGTKLDNHVQVGHNVSIGENCLLCGRVGIAGSAKIGNRVVLGGAVGVADHVTVGDDVVVMAMSGIPGNVKPGSVVGGLPAMPRERMMENYFNIARLRSFFRKVEALAERISKLEAGG